MEKVTINNEVVLMRKFVKQAKIRAINGYTKEIRKLQNRKGSEDATSKFKRKAERLLAKVAILRKIHPDAVSRKALAKEKDWQAVLKEKNIPLEDQCYAMLANYAAVQSEVERFHKKYWDLVPKMPTFFKDWEEKSKDPMSKLEKKKAKEIRKNIKNIKFDKNNSNAVPIGSNNDTLVMKNDISTNKNAVNNANIPRKLMAADHKQIKNELDKNRSKVMSSTVVENNAVTKEEISDKSSKQSKVVLSHQNKSHLQVKNKQIKPGKILWNKKEKIEGGGRSSVVTVDSNEVEMNSEDEINSDEEEHSDEEKDSDDVEVEYSDDEKEHSAEEELNSEDEDSDKEGKSTEQMKSDKEGLSNSPSKFKFSPSNEIKNNEDLKMSYEDSDSENSDVEENEADSESDNAVEDEVTVAINKKPNVPKSKSNASKLAKDSQDIRSRLQALAESKLKSEIKRKRQKKPNSNKLVQENKTKAVAMINLNELLGLDEFPVEKAEDAVEETSDTKNRKDSFFLGKNGEVISESEDEDSPNPFPAKDRPAFKKKKIDDFAKPSSNGDSFKKKNFSTNSPQNSRSGFKGKDFAKNKRDFEEGDSSFKNRAQRRADLKHKGFQNKSFGERKPSKQFKPNAYAEPKNRDSFPKNKTDKPPNKNPVDDKPLHPSWEAKKKLKEIASSKFQGKRIVFND
ncbi:hypothetical protein JTE90_026802 [Oedothorax gibbosus]|uniref:Serum response factor-binding protein 1 n=1 Tax=Oedothorax gibbosus TaxID=931172 RepID=A0AAV6URK8_9ARAC|nr:hypothetical protein JTE90_026802 [Oedothorax gibbosus]